MAWWDYLEVGWAVPFDTDAAQCYAELAVIAKAGRRGFLTPDGYIAAIAVSRGFIMASRDLAPGVPVIINIAEPDRDVFLISDKQCLVSGQNN
jgi:hypothetical protein